MALNQTNKIAWLVETIRKAGRISFEEINQKWIDNEDYSQGRPLPKRTFHNWKNAALDTFGLLIECEKLGTNQYYIANPDDLSKNGMEQWLLDTYTVSNLIMESRSLKERIRLENVPSGREHLDPIIAAMRDSRVLQMVYCRYHTGGARTYIIDPFCVKLFRQRWYMVANLHGSDLTLIFCLDRIRSLAPFGDEQFLYPADFSPDAYFSSCFGIIAGSDMPVEKVVLKVTAHQSNYLRDLPLHPSQEETERHPDHSIFTLYVRPTFDFEQELLWHGEALEVLAPASLRESMAGRIALMHEHYAK